MSQRDTTFRVFISSTFNDMVAERNALHASTFRHLQDYCKRRGARFQAIDLRWGVSEEAALDQQTMKICIGELRRCQQVTPRPNFLVLLGDRYGWRPLPPSISSLEFDPMHARIKDARDRIQLERWYRRDDNALPPEYRLQPVLQDNVQQWSLIESRLRSILLMAADALGWTATDPRRGKYEASATHQEIMEGALNATDPAGSVFVYLRSIQGLPSDNTAGHFSDIAGHSLDVEAQIRLSALKAELRHRLPAQRIREYSAQWRGDQAVFDIGAFCRLVESDIRTVIDSELDASSALADDRGQFGVQIGPYDRFINDRGEMAREDELLYDEPADVLQTISDYLASPSQYPLAICAEPGAGKTALFALAVERAREQHHQSRLVVRFIGATPKSVHGDVLLNDLCRELDRIAGQPENPLPIGEIDIANEFGRRLGVAATRCPIIVFLDGLEQLTASAYIRSLAWIPRELPSNVHLIVSTNEGEYSSRLMTCLPKDSVVVLHACRVVRRSRCDELLDRELRLARRTLQSAQRSEIVNKLEAASSPLFARVWRKFALEEAKQWCSYDGVNDHPYGAKA